jgi:acetyltransferase-like isoleucine patch superfamily enzyme
MTWLSNRQLKRKGFASIGEDVLIDVSVSMYRCSSIHIGSHVRIDAMTELVAGPGKLVIGNHVHISRGCILHAAAGINLSNFVGLAPSVHLLTECDDYSGGRLTNPTVSREFRRVTSLPIRIDKHVAIGTGSVVLPGSKIGVGSSVAALSVVLGRIPAGAIVAGNPIAQIGSRNVEILEKNEARFLRSLPK